MLKRRPGPPDYRQRLLVETPEHVTLGLEIAGIGSRALAALIDVLILVASALSTVILLSMVAGLGVALGSLGGAVILLLGFVVWNGYFILFEGLRQGQTPGKRFVGIRVVGDTGSAVATRGRRRAEPAADRRLPSPALPDRRPAGRVAPEREAAGRHRRRHGRRPRPSGGSGGPSAGARPTARGTGTGPDPRARPTASSMCWASSPVGKAS